MKKIIKNCFILLILCLYSSNTQTQKKNDSLTTDKSLLSDQAFYSIEHYQGQKSYINAFPHTLYKKYTIERIGSFYLDTTNDCIKKVLGKKRIWEEKHHSYIKKYVKPGTIALDIGAHIGTHTLKMSQCIGNKGLVIAFEPQQKIHRELVMNMRLNKCKNVIALRCALGNKNQQVYLGKPIKENEGARYISEIHKVEPIAMRTLDSFCLDNISFIKIDVENLEKEVLEGAYETIMRNRPVILIEIQGNFVKCAEEKRNMADEKRKTIEKLKQLGYTIQHVICRDYLAIPKK